MKIALLLLLIPAAASAQTRAEPPRLPASFDKANHNVQEQKKVPYLATAYVSTSPADLGDGIAVGTLNRPGTDQAVAALIAQDKAGAYANLDSILLWKDGKLLFEMYTRRGRVDGPHYAMSITKTMTSVTLARAMQLGHLTMDDLDKPVIDFLPAIDRSTIQSGVDTITLRDALLMKSGLRWTDNKTVFKLGLKHQKQDYFQQLFEQTKPVTPASKTYKYTGTDPSLIMMIIDVKTGGKSREFINREVAEKVGATYVWDNQGCGIPKCGAGSNWTSRSLLKIGTTVIQGGKYNGEQLLSPEYVKLILDTNKGDGYFYFFHNRNKVSADKSTIDFISGIGAGGQYMALFPQRNIVAVATSHNKGQIGKPLVAILDQLIPLF